jgi:hypothetical protein
MPSVDGADRDTFSDLREKVWRVRTTSQHMILEPRFKLNYLSGHTVYYRLTIYYLVQEGNDF